MTETLCTSGAVKLRASVNASTAITNSPANMTLFINQAEGDLFADTRVDWVAIYSGLSANYKQVLEGAAASKAAIRVISYDPDAIGRTTAAFIINVLWAEYNQAVRVLKDDKLITAMGGSLKT